MVIGSVTMPRARPARDVCIRSEAPWMKRRPHHHPEGDQTQTTVTTIPFPVSVDEQVLKRAGQLARELTVRFGDEGAVACAQAVCDKSKFTAGNVSATESRPTCFQVRPLMILGEGVSFRVLWLSVPTAFRSNTTCTCHECSTATEAYQP